MKKIVKNGNVVTDSQVFQADILIEDEKVKLIGADLEEDGAEVIDASGKYVFPGAVDVHTHMDLQAGKYRAVDDFYDGTVAAACGGTTTIVDHMAFGPKGCSLWHQVEEYHRIADGKAVIDYGFHGVLQHVNESILKEMGEIAEKDGITSFKVYMTYDFMLKDDELYRVLKQAKEDGIVIAVPMAGDAPLYIVHLSSKEGLLEVMKARASHQKNLGVETCTQYLTLTDDMYQDPKEGLKAIMSPPLRKKEDNEALWAALRDDVLDTVATDHCPFNYGIEKQAGADDFTACPNGGPGVEERFRVMYSEGVAKGRISLPQFVKYLCTNPARMYGMYPQKGILLPDSDADLVIFDPEKSRVLTHADMHSAVDYTCYEGMKVQGDIDLVMQRGNVIVRDNQFLGKRGDGRYLKRGKGIIAE